MKRTVFILTLLLAILIPSSVAMAARFDRIVGDGETVHGDVTVVDDNLIVEAGGVIEGDVTVFSGDADVAGEIVGDVTLFSGHLALNGQIEGDLVLFGGNLTLEPDAVLDGSCVVLGGSVEDNSRSISCSSVGSRFGMLGLAQIPQVPLAPTMPEMPEAPSQPPMPHIEVYRPSLAARIGDFMLDASVVVGRSVLMGVLALLIAAVFPTQLRQVSDAVRARPATSGAVGLLTAVAAPSIIVLLLVVLAITCVGLLLYPAVFLLGVGLFAAALLGWVAVGEIVGRKLIGLLGQKQGLSLSLTAALGTALLTLVLGGLGLLPFIWGEGLVVAILASVGLGAATLTQFGVKRYPPEDEPPVDPDKEESVLRNLPQ